MKKINLFLIVLIAIIALQCKHSSDSLIQIRPLDNLKKIDLLLSDISQKSQFFYTRSDKSTKVIGQKGTIIYVDPKNLETKDGSALGDTIEIELLEITDKYSFITNNVQTISDKNLLVTGGAYYINMKSNGKELKVKQGHGIKIEFPKLSNEEMALFLGERDSLDQINWIPTDQKFIEKKQEQIESPEIGLLEKTKRYNIAAVRITEGEIYEDTAIIEPKEVKREEVTEEEYKDYLNKKAQYKKKLKEIETQRQTYEAIEILNFGWINCDRFYEYQTPLTNIDLLFNQDSISSARFYAVFEDINSILITNYWDDKETTTQFINIPTNMQIKIICLALQDSIPFWYETDILTKESNIIKVNLVKTTQVEIRENLKNLLE